jgi:hypothetical protein
LRNGIRGICQAISRASMIKLLRTGFQGGCNQHLKQDFALLSAIFAPPKCGGAQ